MFFTNLFESNLQVKNFAKKVIYYTSTDSTNDDKASENLELSLF